MKRSLCVLVALALVTLPAWAADPDAGKLMKERLDAQRVDRGISDEMRNATAGLQSESYGLGQLASMLGRPPMTDEQIAETKKRMESDKSQIESLQRDLESLQKQIEMAAIKDPAERAAKQKDFQAQEKAANDKLNAAREPFNKRQSELRQQLTKTDPDYIALLDNCFKSGADKFALAVQRKPGYLGQVHWVDAGKDAVWCAYFLQDKPYVTPTFAGAKLLNGKYGYNFSGNSVSVQAGYFNVSFVINKAEWSADEATAVALVRSLADFDAIAALKSE